MKSPATSTLASRLKTARKAIIASSALFSVGGLLALAAFPANLTMRNEDASAASVQSQNLVSDIAEPGMRTLEVIGEVGVEALPALTIGASGRFDSRLLTNTKLRYPFDREVRLTDGFGYRSAPVAGFHNAQDLDPGEGTPINIVGDGIVLKAQFNDWCGFGLEVQHKVDGEDVTTLYCHMQSGSHSYEVGDMVKAGDIAGRVGNTGQSFGAHLHLVLRVNGEPVDPLPFIAKNSI